METKTIERVETAPLKGGVCTYARQNEEPCKAPATHGYLWDWGETGCACPRHVGELQQLAGNLGRNVTFTSLDPHAPAPMQRDERVRMNATILTLEAELAEAKQRGLEMYQQNAQLAGQAQAATLRSREAQSQLDDASEDLADERDRADRALAELAEHNDEVQRLRAILDAKPSGRVSDLQSENSELRKLLAESTVTELQNENAGLRKLVTELQNELSEATKPE